MSDDKMDDHIENIKNDHDKIKEHLSNNNMISLELTLDDVFKKNVLLSAASYFEDRITTILTDLYVSNYPEGRVLAEFVKNQAIKQQYFKLFDWGTKSAKRFFKLFGEDFNKHMQEKVQDDYCLDDSIKAFLELGELRDKLIHNNLAAYSLDKTPEEIFDLYEKATHFVETFPSDLENYIRQTNP